MAQQFIVLDITGQAALDVINDNFTELYDAITPPIIVVDMAANTNIVMPANSYIDKIIIIPQSGSPVLNIGLTGNGGEILNTMAITGFLPVLVQEYFAPATDFYFTLIGGIINVYIYYIRNLS